MINQVDNDIAVLAILAEFLSTPAMSLVPLATALRLAAALGRRSRVAAVWVRVQCPSRSSRDRVFQARLSPDNPQTGIAYAEIY